MELVRFPSRGGFSVRSIIMFCLTVLLTGFLWILFGTTPVHAAATDANWSGDTILYDNHGYQSSTDKIDDSHGLADGTSIYLYIPTVNGATSNAKNAYFIYFAPGTDPPTATSADYAVYDYDGTKFSNPHDKKTITLTKKGDESTYSSCDVSGGMGWIVCPATLFLADTMDNLFNIMAGMIAVQPMTVQTGADNGLYTAWNIMRNIANVAFVIAFLVIIYSQLTNVGINNYGLKKLIPRLIVAAVLVNLSFYISALAIDLSNVIGYSIQDIFHNIRETVFHMTDDTLTGAAGSNWSLAATAILGGGGLAIGGVYAVANGALYLLIPMLIGLVLTVLVVVIILAARQAIIIIMVIVAPLAFVANLLPNTEKLFDKWKDLFMTMLVFFPAFSLAFGGAQLAGQLIIKNAGDNLVMVLFGMAVQVAPLVITPLLLKMSGGLLGKIAQIVNNPKKGVLDRNKNWANDRKTLHRNRNVGRTLAGRSRGDPRTWGTRMVKGNEFRKRALKEGIDAYGQHAENRYKETGRHHRLHENMAGANLDKDGISARNDAHIERLKVTPGSSLYGRTIATQVSKDELEAAQNRTNVRINTQRINSTSALHASTIDLEASKSGLETSDNRLKAYVTQQRTLAGGALRHTVAPLEESKLHLEGAQSRYTAMVDGMKAVPGSAMSDAAFTAQAAKELAENAQTHLQTHFDLRRRVVGSELNTSMLDLELTKRTSDAEKALTAAYLGSEKLNVGSMLHTETVRAERAKLAQQVSETQVNKMVEEYKSGERAADGLLAGTGIVETMVEDVEQFAAETRGVQSAQNMQKQHIAQAFRATDPATGNPTARANQLLADAGSVDLNGRGRAAASAIAQLASIEKEARDNNKILLEEQSEQAGVPILEYARSLTSASRAAATPPLPEEIPMLEAAYDVIADNGVISDIRDARMNSVNVDQDMLTRVIGRNAPALMGKGGYDLQSNYALAGATREQMDVSIAFSLAGVSADKISGQNFAWLQYLAEPGKNGEPANLKRIIASTEAHTPDGVNPKDSTFYLDMLKTFYTSATQALTNPEIAATLGGRREPTIAIHEMLHAHFKDAARAVDYKKARSGQS